MYDETPVACSVRSREARHHVRAGGATAVGAASGRFHARAGWPAAPGRPANPVSASDRWLRRLGDDILTEVAREHGTGPQ